MAGPINSVAGLVFAGGRSQRMGRHKALIEIGGASLLEQACGRLIGVCDPIAVSLHEEGPVAEFASRHGMLAIFDPPATPSGPLGGIVAGLNWTKSIGAEMMLTIPCDAPLLPPDLPLRLIAAAADSPCAAARTTRGVEPLCGLAVGNDPHAASQIW